jgi:hypothetical protein
VRLAGLVGSHHGDFGPGLAVRPGGRQQVRAVTGFAVGGRLTIAARGERPGAALAARW